MSNLSITPQWNDEINQVEPGELISAGPTGNANLATRQLAENIWYLKNIIDSKTGVTVQNAINIDDLLIKFNLLLSSLRDAGIIAK
jgi:hypothetical protein